MGSEFARWLVTPGFAAAGAFALRRGVRRGPVVARVSGGLELALCAGMIAMTWPALSPGRLAQLLVYGFALVWFTVLAACGHPGKPTLGYHAAMAAAGVWLAQGDDMAGGMAGGPTMGGPVAIGWTVVFAVAGGGGLVRAAAAVRAAGGFRLPAAELAADAVMGLGMAVMTGALG